MKNINTVLIILLLGTFSCRKNEVVPSSKYQKVTPYLTSTSKGIAYQKILNNYIEKGILGTSVMIRDQEGTWLGAGGMADIASNIPMETGHQFMIASISKVFTATTIFSLIDEGKLKFDDSIIKWLDQDVIDKVDNVKDAKIQHLLGHTSGIKDYYTIEFEMARNNRKNHYWNANDILEYTFGKKANFPVGTTYAYSNTNYVLLGLIIEKITGSSLKNAFYKYIFDKLSLSNAFFDSGENAAPESLIKGYMSLYGHGYIESDFLYEDELSTGDGGVVINAYDLGVFIDALMKGHLLSEKSLKQMQNWFDIVEDGENGKNGFGLEFFKEDLGISYGHTGGVDGFTSFAEYFPIEDVTIIMLFNFSPDYDVAQTLKSFRKALVAESLK